MNSVWMAEPGSKVYTVRVSRTFSAAHYIKGRGGKCENVHGHNYRVEVAVRSKDLEPPGMVVDFVDLREHLDRVLPDHRSLNEVYDFNPTAENLARHFYEELLKSLAVCSVRVWESDTSSAEYSAD